MTRGLAALVAAASWASTPGVESTRYWDVVDRYASGEIARAVDDLERLPGAIVPMEIDRLREAAQSPETMRELPERSPLAVAAMLHTDAAWWADAGSARRFRELARACAFLHVLRAREPGWGFARRWFLASILRGHQRMDWDATNWVATAGLSRFPDDPSLLLAHGTVLEVEGW